MKGLDEIRREVAKPPEPLDFGSDLKSKNNLIESIRYKMKTGEDFSPEELAFLEEQRREDREQDQPWNNH